MLNYTVLSFTIFQRVLQMGAEEIPHELIYIDEAGFNLTKARRRGRNIIGHGAIIRVPGQRGGNITLCAAITQNGVLLRHTSMGPHSTPHILTCLDRLHNIVTAVNHRHQMQHIVIWDNVSFHRSALVQNWFQHHPQFTELCLPPYSPFLNPIKEFFSACRWRVYDLRPQAQVALIETCPGYRIFCLSDICWAFSVMHTTVVAWKLGHVLLWFSMLTSWLIWVYGEK